MSGEPATLSGDTKDALARLPVEAEHCRCALRDALLRYGAGSRSVFRTQRSSLARLLRSLMDDSKAHPIRRVAHARLRGRADYEIDVSPPSPETRKLARCDRRMELRGAFLACGSLALPARGYHLEFVAPDDVIARRLGAALRAEGLAPRLAPRRGRTILYFKSIDQIAHLLATIGATDALFALEDVRAVKETKNRIHRLVNTEAANVDRAARAAAVAGRAIALVLDAYGLRRLPPPLREIAELRLAHPTETLAELGRRCNPQVKKSTVNARIAALVRMAERVAPSRTAAGAHE